jgi:hypothetical protein
MQQSEIVSVILLFDVLCFPHAPTDSSSASNAQSQRGRPSQLAFPCRMQRGPTRRDCFGLQALPTKTRPSNIRHRVSLLRVGSEVEGELAAASLAQQNRVHQRTGCRAGNAGSTPIDSWRWGRTLPAARRPSPCKSCPYPAIVSCVGSFFVVD